MELGLAFLKRMFVFLPASLMTIITRMGKDDDLKEEGARVIMAEEEDARMVVVRRE